MPEVFRKKSAFLYLSIVLAGGLANFAIAASAADIKETRTENLRLSQNSQRNCMEGCIAQCRAALASCESGKSNSNCRTQFQICARRCVVACGGR